MNDRHQSLNQFVANNCKVVPILISILEIHGRNDPNPRLGLEVCIHKCIEDQFVVIDDRKTMLVFQFAIQIGSPNSNVVRDADDMRKGGGIQGGGLSDEVIFAPQVLLDVRSVPQCVSARVREWRFCMLI